MRTIVSNEITAVTIKLIFQAPVQQPLIFTDSCPILKMDTCKHLNYSLNIYFMFTSKVKKGR